MKNQKLIVLILLSIVLALGAVNLTAPDSINNIIDYYVDRAGNYYYLDYHQTNTYLYKVSPQGTIIFKEKLPKSEGALDLYHKKVVVDKEENIYLLTVTTEKDASLVSQEMVRLYNPQGKYQNITYKIELEVALRHDNPFDNMGGRLIQLQYIDERLYLFDRRDKLEIALIEIELGQESSDVIRDKKRILFNDDVQLTDIIYTSTDEVYLANRQAEIYRIGPAGNVEQISTSYNIYNRVVPDTLSSDSQGNLYFVDVHNQHFVMYKSSVGVTQPLFDYSYIISKNKQVTFEELRNVQIFNGDQLYAHSRIGGTSNYLSFLGNEQNNGIILDNINPPLWQLAVTYLSWGGGLFLFLLGLMWIRDKFSQRIGLHVKQILIFMPIFVGMMLFFVFILNSMITSSNTKLVYDQLESVTKTTAKLMDREKFKQLNHPSDDFSQDYLDIVNQVEPLDGLYYVTYYLEREQLYVGVSTTIQSCTPIEYLYDQATLSVYYNTVTTGKSQHGSTIDSYGEWVFALTPILDENNRIIGILEIGTHGAKITEGIKGAERQLAIIVLIITATVVVAYAMMLKYSLHPLDILKNGVAEVAAGRWDTRIEVETKDEFREISYAFNRMSQYIQDYVDELTKFNDAYVKFLPAEFFTLLNKKNILEVNLGDQTSESMIIFYVNTRNISEHLRRMSSQESLLYLNQVLAIISKVIAEHKGIIQRFEGAGVVALFKEDASNAVNAALKIQELFTVFNSEQNQQVELGITIHRGEVLLGIVGHEQRLAATLISEQAHNTMLIEKISAKLGTKLLLTANTLQYFSAKENHEYRYIGRVKENYSSQLIELYEFFVGDEQQDKNLKLVTKDLFEQGVHYFQQKQFFEARKKFIDVIRVDSNNKLARAYLFLCEKHNEEPPTDWEGVLDYL